MSYATSSIGHGTGGRPVKVLIADDHPVVRQGLKAMLAADPEVDVVAEARDGDEAFDVAHKVDWDVAVLDSTSNENEILCRIYRDLTSEQWFVAGIYD